MGADKLDNPFSKLENPIWWVQQGQGAFHMGYYPAYACNPFLKSRFKHIWNIIVMPFKGSDWEWIGEEKDMIRTAKALLNDCKDKIFQKNFFNSFRKKLKVYEDFCKKLETTNLKELLDEELIKLYDRFCYVYYDEYSLPLLCDHFGLYSEKIIRENVEKLLKKNNQMGKLTKYLEILTTPHVKSFVNEEELELLNIAKDAKNVWKQKLSPPEFTSVLKKEKALWKRMQTHAKNYFWLMNNYAYPRILKEDFFVERIYNMLSHDENLENEIVRFKQTYKEIPKKRDALLKKLTLNEETVYIISLIDKFTGMHDLRKKANIRASYYAWLFLKEVARRTKVPLEDLKWVIPPEIEGLIRTRDFDREKLKKRKRHMMGVFIDGKVWIFEGEESEQLRKEMEKQIDKGTGEITGFCASAGVAVGRVKKLKGPTEACNMNPSDILVTSMTRPDFMVAVKKAAAIVTDEGGLTCHAAIVSRELGIPCIIGTKNATKVLKDRDLVEVNADKGVVKILERAK